jgi:hypothetical protein
MSQSSSNVGPNGVFHRECLQNMVKSKWTDVALIVGTIVFLLIGILASSGVFNSIGTSQAAHLSYGMYGGAALLFVAEIIKRVTLCVKTDVTANSKTSILMGNNEDGNMHLFPSIAEIYLGNEHQANQETKLPNEVMNIIAQKYANFASDTALYFFKQLM